MLHMRAHMHEQLQLCVGVYEALLAYTAFILLHGWAIVRPQPDICIAVDVKCFIGRFYRFK